MSVRLKLIECKVSSTWVWLKIMILNAWMIGALHDCKTTTGPTIRVWMIVKAWLACWLTFIIPLKHLTSNYSVPWFIGTEFLHLKHDSSENHFCKPHPRDLGPLQGTTLAPWTSKRPPVSAKVPNLHPALAVDMVAKPPMAATHNSAETVLTAYPKDTKEWKGPGQGRHWLMWWSGRVHTIVAGNVPWKSFIQPTWLIHVIPRCHERMITVFHLHPTFSVPSIQIFHFKSFRKYV